MSLVTVIVPVADAHRFLLPRAIYSLKQQTYPPEILVVNDSSTPLLTSGAKILETGGGKGTAYARNLGLDHVRTPLVSFLDADDYYLDTALETMLRAYAAYETCYIYSDWYQYSEGMYQYRNRNGIAQNYDRKSLIRHSLHLVNILIETDVAKSVYYDINYRGWEDQFFHLELAEHGYCGTRVPEPLLIYDMTTSINRVKHNSIENEVYPQLLEKYKDYLEGVKEFMPCSTCGGNTRSQANQVIQAFPPAPEDGFVVMEYLGANTAPIPFTVNRNKYKGANDDSNKFVQVLYQDVQGLIDKGMWRKVVKATKPATVPQPEAFNEWRQMQPPTEIPQDWKKHFEQNAVLVGNEPVKKKRHGRTKGSKNKPKVVPAETVEHLTVYDGVPTPRPETA